MLESIPTGIIIANKSGIISFQNHFAVAQLGDYRGQTITVVFPSFPVQIFAGNSDEFPMIHSENIMGNTLYIECRINRDVHGNFMICVQEGDVREKQLREIEIKKNAAEILLKSAILGTGLLDEALAEVCRIASAAMEVTRANIWEFGEGQSSITSIANYDSRFPALLPNSTLYRYQIPKYFRLFETEEIIPTRDALNDPNTEELKTGYLDVHGIRSLMDVPIRISGKMIGVVCFEDTNEIREWNPGEQKFGLFISQVIALAIESSRRKKAQQELELILDEKRVLLNEIHRRVRNNFSLIQDLIRAESSRANDDYHRDLFRDLRDRISSLDMLQRQLYQSAKVDRVNFRDLILDLVAGYRATFSGRSTDFITTLDQCELNVSQASICGLFVNEIIMFLLSEASKQKTRGSVSIRLKKINTHIHLSIISTMEIDARTEKERMLNSHELASKLGSKLEIDRSKGISYCINFES